MISQIDGVQARDNGQSFSEMVAVGEIQVEHIAHFGVLGKVKDHRFGF